MGWPFSDIREPFLQHGLCLPQIALLDPTPTSCEVLAIQPGGEIESRSDFIGHEDRVQAVAKFDRLIDLSIDRNIDLLLAPEYSVPWDCLERAFKERRLPPSGKLWALGCESITPLELQELESRVPDIVWIHEPPAKSSRSFLDCLCYVLQTDSTDGQSRYVALLQFKTIPMAGGNSIERDNLIPGTQRYFLRNRGEDFLRFVTILCSEALSFDVDREATRQLFQYPTLIFHPQLVPDTRHENMRRYRAEIYTKTCGSNVEVFSLNWASLMRQPAPDRGNSSYFLRHDKFTPREARLQKNHTLGVYYSRWQCHRAELFAFSYHEHVFHFSVSKTGSLGAAVQASRTGPEMQSTWRWEVAQSSWVTCASVDDGFRDLCRPYGASLLAICVDGALSSLDVERLLALTCGQIKASADWHVVTNMSSYTAETDERTKRVTFVHDQYGDSQRFRELCLESLAGLLSRILVSPELFPDCISDLIDNYRLIAPRPADGFRHNIIPRSPDGAGATAIFLGHQRREAALALHDGLCTAWGEERSQLREERTRRLVVWYETSSGAIDSVHPPAPSIADDSEPPSSIARGSLE